MDTNFEGALHPNGSEFFHNFFSVQSRRKKCKKYDEMKNFAPFYFILILEAFKGEWNTQFYLMIREDNIKIHILQ